MSRAPSRPSDHVFAVHTARPDDAGAVEIVFITEAEARAFAQDRSRDHRVASASVTRFVIGQLGARYPVCWFVDGIEERQDFDRRLYPAAGPGR